MIDVDAEELVIRQPFRLKRFLRSYLAWIVVTLILIVAIQIGVIWIFVKSTEGQRRLAAQIESLGGRVEFEFAGPSWFPQSARYCGNLKLIMLTTTNQSLPDGLLSDIGSLKSLKTLWLLGPQVTDEAVANLKDLKSLTGLYLGYSELGDAGVEHLKGLTGLEWIFLLHNQVGDKSCETLKGLTNLKSIALNEAKITDDGLKALSTMSGLEYIGLEGTAVSDDGVTHLSGMASLKKIHIGNTRISKEGEATLQKALPGCDVGSMSNTASNRTRK